MVELDKFQNFSNLQNCPKIFSENFEQLHSTGDKTFFPWAY